MREAWLEGEITRVWKESTERSGARKVWEQLHREHIVVARCTVERLMRRLGLRGVRRGGYKPRTTVADAFQHRPVDLVDRDFRVDAPNRLWVADFCFIATWAGTAYTALVIDAFARRIVGWRTACRHRTDLVLDALVMAIAARHRQGMPPAGAIHHNDAGAEYCSIRYGHQLTAAGMVPSVGSVGDSYDNAPRRDDDRAVQDRGHRPSRAMAARRPGGDGHRRMVGWFNQTRLFGPIGYVPLAEYEAAHHARQASEETANNTNQ